MFEVVLSSGALHHICHNFADHEQTIGEMVRVLKPGGQMAIWDITHMIEATASRMWQAGLECEIREGDRFLGFEMSLLLGQKAG